MGQPRNVSAYGTDHLSLLLDATHTKQSILFPITEEDTDPTDARRRATAFVHRTNGLKRALVREGHSMAADCTNVKVRMPKEAEGGWRVDMDRANLWGYHMVRLTPTLRAEDPAPTPAQALRAETPELDFDALLDEEL